MAKRPECLCNPNVRPYLTPQVGTVKELFAAADRDGNGSLDSDELRNVLRRLDMGCVELFKYYDADGSGTVDKDELSAAVRSSLQLTIRQSEVDTLIVESEWSSMSIDAVLPQ